MFDRLAVESATLQCIIMPMTQSHRPVGVGSIDRAVVEGVAE